MSIPQILLSTPSTPPMSSILSLSPSSFSSSSDSTSSSSSPPHPPPLSPPIFEKESSLHVCDIVDCKKTFFTKFQLRKHKLTHAEMKPHRCNFCEKSYSRRDNLLRHLNSSHKESPKSPSVTNPPFVPFLLPTPPPTPSPELKFENTPAEPLQTLVFSIPKAQAGVPLSLEDTKFHLDVLERIEESIDLLIRNQLQMMNQHSDSDQES